MENLFAGYGLTSNGMLHLSPKEALEVCHLGAILVDVREDYLNEYKKFKVERVIYLPLSLLKENAATLPLDIPLVFADSAGLRSKEAVAMLKELGFQNIANLAGGLIEWERDGLPLQTNEEEMLSGSCTCQLRKRNKKV